MNANSREILAPAMRTDQPALQDPSVAIRELTKTAVSVWPKGVAPKRPVIAKVRGRIMWGQIEPMRPLYVMALGAIDEGKPVGVVVQWAKDFIASVEAYAARRERRQSLGVIPISEAHDRMLVAAIREDAEADCREATVDLDSIASLEAARAERLEAMAKDERKVEFYTARLAQFRSAGSVERAKG